MRCAELLELVLQPLLLMQLVLCILIWCTMMLYFSVSGINVKFINMFLLFLFVSIETFGYCYLGTQLSQESINVGKALYDADWIDYDAVMRKKVAFMIMRAQCRVGLTAAKFCFVDMEQFVAMLNMSYSIFVVLKDVF
ncbi:odorant receptor 67a-like [Anopheles stephensi]|uniref:odorant receptor 67a-like n=1 Tax=Anopheles stephensi TaxID=30069 RepID=UPI001658AF36|nr:odorant receptor 67a-like [Anopheles stephensi]